MAPVDSWRPVSPARAAVAVAAVRPRWLLLVVMLALMVAAAGCTGRATGTESGSQSATRQVITVVFEGRSRDVIVYRPAGTTPVHGFPLVMMLHGGLGSASQAESSYGWDAMADNAGFVVAYPDGVDRTWNAGSCCGQAQRADIDDVGFLTEVVSQVSTLVPIDESRRYLTGMSNGAMMTYRMACQSSLFAAIAPVSGTQLVDCETAKPTSVLHIHGADDSSVRLDGAQGGGPGRVSGPPLAQVIEGWRSRDDCAAPRAVVAGEVTTTTAQCPAGRTVTWIVVAGAGHQWPGSKKSTYPGADAPSQALDATAVIWEFFDKHR